MTEKNFNSLTCILFCIVGSIYFATAGYSIWFSKDYDQISANISLGIMFVLIGVSFFTFNKK